MEECFDAPRTPVSAAILAFVVPGLGHFYAGSPRQGLVLTALGWPALALLSTNGELAAFLGGSVTNSTLGPLLVFSLGLWVTLYVWQGLHARSLCRGYQRRMMSARR